MDGFYVAKIIKLSDLKPEDTLEPVDPDEEVVTEKVKANKEDKSSGKKKKKKHLPKHKKKRKSDEELGEQEGGKTKVSVPPPKAQPKIKKQKTNAKVTKPRRKRAATDA